MVKDNFGDWRIAFVTTLVEDQPSAYVGGPSHKAGAPVYVSSLLKNEELGLLGFVSPHPTALAFNLALKFAKNARELRSQLTIEDSVTPYGKGKMIANKDLPPLFDFFENYMVTVAFCFQSIEAFVNSKLSEFTQGKVKVKRKKGIVEYETFEAERYLSTDEKLTQVLPQLLKVPNPSGKKIWTGYKLLKDVRDSTIHFKSKEISTKYQVDTDSLYYHFFATDPVKHVVSAYEMVNYFMKHDDLPRWFEAFSKILNISKSNNT